MMRVAELDDLRRRGIALIAIGGWCCTAALLAIGLAVHADMLAPAIGLSVLTNIAPSRAAWRGAFDRTARLLAGTVVAVQPAIGVYLLNGHSWQMDGHMYFFVGLAALAVLCDWRPLVLATALIALHHLLLEYFAPEWVFAGTGNLGRVMVHAVAVVLQAVILAVLGATLRRLMLAQGAARSDSEQAAALAGEHSRTLEAAMAEAQAADVREGRERQRREHAERTAQEARRSEMEALAAAFRTSVSLTAAGVDQAAQELDRSAQALALLARRASRRSADTALAAGQSSTSAVELAERIEELAASVVSIAASAGHQAQLSGATREMSREGADAVRTLDTRTSAIADFAGSISEIAARTNLLALNASIEAARAGEVGRGFAVVAGEVKLLASQATGATNQIRTLAGAMHGGTTIARQSLEGIAAQVDELAEAARAINQAAGQQRATAGAIESSARLAANGATLMVQQMQAVAGDAGDTERLSGEVSGAASGLARTAQDLRAATDRFVDQLLAG